MIPQSQKKFRNLKPQTYEQRVPAWAAVNGWLLKGRGRGDRLSALTSGTGGADPCNTAPPLLHSVHSSGGLDCLELTVYGVVREHYTSTVKKLLILKHQLQDGDSHGCSVLAGGLWCRLRRTGAGVGFAHCPIFLEYGGIRLRLRDREPGQTSSMPLMFIEIPGKTFLEMGERKAIRTVQEFVRWLGIDSLKISVRRVDVNVDLVGSLRSRFRAAVRAGRFRSKAGGRITEYSTGRKWTGFSVDGSLCSMTVYDKLEEVLTESPDKLPGMIKYRWNGEQPTQAWRVEFRVRPGEKQRLEWNNFADLLSGLGTICHWCCMTWFRLVSVIKKNHSEREALDSVWFDVVSAFGAWAAEYIGRFSDREKQAVNCLHLAKCAYGVLAAACVTAGVDPTDKTVEDILHEVAYRRDIGDESQCKDAGEWATLRAEFENRYWTRQVGLVGKPMCQS